jgi:Flp pilus assembly CpaF family ATPase
MKQLSEFLERFIKLAQSSDDAKQAIIDALQKSGVRVNGGLETVVIRGTIATLRFSPIQKSEVSLRQEKIIALLKENPLTKHITVVR